jgi:hypothetical protein
MVAQDAHPLAIKERLGHSSITVTLAPRAGCSLPWTRPWPRAWTAPTGPQSRTVREQSRTRAGHRASGDRLVDRRTCSFLVGMPGLEPGTVVPQTSRHDSATSTNAHARPLTCGFPFRQLSLSRDCCRRLEDCMRTASRPLPAPGPGATRIAARTPGTSMRSPVGRFDPEVRWLTS